MSLKDRISNLRSSDNSSEKRSIKRRIRQDIRAADRGARGKGDELKRRVRQDVRTAGRRARNIDSQDARRAIRRVGQSVEGVEASAQDDPRGRDTSKPAEEAATMGAPIMASFEPTTTPQDVHNFASGGLMADSGEDDGQQEPMGFGGFEMASDIGFNASPNEDRDSEEDIEEGAGFGFDVDVGGMAMGEDVGFGLNFGDDDNGGLF